MNPTPNARSLLTAKLPIKILAGTFALPLAAFAEATLVPYVSSTTSYDSNLYRVQTRAQVPQGPNRAKSDLIFTNSAGLDSAYTWSQQRLYALAEGTRYDYLNNSDLGQNAFRLQGGLDWSLFGRVKGSLTAANSRSSSSFANANTTVLNSQRTRTFGASTNFLVTNDVRFTGTYTNNVQRLPALTATDLRLEENTSTAALDYLGINRWTVGLLGRYSFGDYSGTGIGSSFDQYSGSATLGYEISGLSKFRFAAGYTTREDAIRGGKTSGFTGAIGYSRELTGKTSVNVDLSRSVDSFVAGDNSVVSISVYGGLNWEATAKLKSTLSYNYVRSDYRSSPGTVTVFTGRRDDVHMIKLAAGYEALRWLTVTPAFGYDRRTTTIGGFDFDSAQASLQLTARFD